MTKQTNKTSADDKHAVDRAPARQRVRIKAAAPVATEPKGKIAALVALLMRPEGATLEAMRQASGWQAHSVRGAISGSIKKKLGLNVTSEKTDDGRTYRIAKGA